MPHTVHENPVAIVGGGIAGLVALAHLARAAVPVVLFEKSETLGGRARTDTIDGFPFNLGAHALYRTGALKKGLAELGVEVRGHRPPVQGGFAIIGGKKATMPAGFLSLLVTDLFSLSGKLELARIMHQLMKPSTAKNGAKPTESFDDYVRRSVNNAEVRMFLLALLRVSTYSTRPDAIAARTALDQIRMGVFEGVEYLDGGWGTIVQGLERCALEAGARIVRGAPIDQIELEDGLVRRIRTKDGDSITVSAAILAMPPRGAARLLSGEAKAWCEAEALRAIPATTSCLDVSLRRLPDPRALFGLGIDRPLYFSVHSNTAAGALVHLMKYGDGGDRTALESLLDLMQPGWRREVVHARFLPDMVAAHAIIRPSTIAARTSGEVPGAGDLYVAGDWVGEDHHLADASYASGQAAAQAIIASTRGRGARIERAA